MARLSAVITCAIFCVAAGSRPEVVRHVFQQESSDTPEQQLQAKIDPEVEQLQTRSADVEEQIKNLQNEVEQLHKKVDCSNKLMARVENLYEDVFGGISGVQSKTKIWKAIDDEHKKLFGIKFTESGTGMSRKQFFEKMDVVTGEQHDQIDVTPDKLNDFLTYLKQSIVDNYPDNCD